MTEARTNPIDGRTVFYAPARTGRPHDIALPQAIRGYGDPANCPFCLHNACRQTVLDQVSAPGGGWLTLAVANRYPLLDPHPVPPEPAPAPYSVAAGQGWHEVIIETPRHQCDLPELEPPAMAAVMEIYQRRHQHLAARTDVGSILLFRNRGPAAGASLAHPHAQIVALPRPPDAVLRRRSLAREHYGRHRRCLLQDVAATEIADGRRMLHHDDSFAAFVPFAAEVPGEIWIVPTMPRATFRRIEDAERLQLGQVLQRCLVLLRRAFRDPDYNIVICDSPVGDEADPSQCWDLRIYPRFSRYGGYEIGWGDRINPSLPELDAAALRAAGTGNRTGDNA